MDKYQESDRAALDRLAEFFRLPEWNIGDSAADFIECVAEVVGSRRDITAPASPDFLSEFGYDTDPLDGACPEDPDGMHFVGCGCES